MSNELKIIFGTETGNSESLAMDANKLAPDFGLDANFYGMDEIEVNDLQDAKFLMVICSTWGDGEQPDNALDLFEATEALSDSDLSDLKFAVLALGDTAFDLFCEAGIQWDNILEEKGATRVNERIDCDVDYDDEAEEWIEATLKIFSDIE